MTAWKWHWKSKSNKLLCSCPSDYSTLIIILTKHFRLPDMKIILFSWNIRVLITERSLKCETMHNAWVSLCCKKNLSWPILLLTLVFLLAIVLGKLFIGTGIRIPRIYQHLSWLANWPSALTPFLWPCPFYRCSLFLTECGQN